MGKAIGRVANTQKSCNFRGRQKAFEVTVDEEEHKGFFNFGHNKMEQQTPNPPALKSRMNPLVFCRLFLFVCLYFCLFFLEVGLNFLFILSKIVETSLESSSAA